jgi:hypothetical protein
MTTNNTLADLNQHLFLQLERLSEDCMTLDQVEMEAKRADAIVAVADQIARNADLTLKAIKIVADHGDRFLPQLTMIAPASESRPAIENKPA